MTFPIRYHDAVGAVSFAPFKIPSGPTNMRSYVATVLFRSDPTETGYLPEGPIDLGNGIVSWVGIQHGSSALAGSLNHLDVTSGENQQWLLAGRPGFAFPFSKPGQFLIGLERQLILFDHQTESVELLVDQIDAGVDNTIINDGVLTRDGVIFGCKDLEFATPKAGLYFWNHTNRELHQLSADQICSNGKVLISESDQAIEFLNIDTPTRQVRKMVLDRASGSITQTETVLDLSDQPGFPDGMVGSPDGKEVIIALFNPEDAEHGLAKSFDLATGEETCRWQTDGSPQVTCPLLVNIGQQTRLLLTTAAENMDEEKRSRHANAGCLFLADTHY